MGFHPEVTTCLGTVKPGVRVTHYELLTSPELHMTPLDLLLPERCAARVCTLIHIEANPVAELAACPAH